MSKIYGPSEIRKLAREARVNQQASNIEEVLESLGFAAGNDHIVGGYVQQRWSALAGRVSVAMMLGDEAIIVRKMTGVGFSEIAYWVRLDFSVPLPVIRATVHAFLAEVQANG